MTTHPTNSTQPATRTLSFALLAGVLALASLGSSPALSSEPAAASLPAAEAPVVPIDEPVIDPAQIDPVRQGSRPAACGPITFQDCCFRTVPSDCTYLCKYDKFASTCTPGVTICKAMNVTPGAQSTSHPYFSTRTSTGKYQGYSMMCTSVP